MTITENLHCTCYKLELEGESAQDFHKRKNSANLENYWVAEADDGDTYILEVYNIDGTTVVIDSMYDKNLEGLLEIDILINPKHPANIKNAIEILEGELEMNLDKTTEVRG